MTLSGLVLESHLHVALGIRVDEVSSEWQDEGLQ